MASPVTSIKALHPALAAVAVDTAAALTAAPRVWVAYSGGLDSTTLLHLLATQTGLPLAAVHLNHQWHPDAERWEQDCAAQCSALSVPLELRRLSIEEDGRGAEAAARTARYAEFTALLAAEEVLLLAQHQDDQAETLLLRLLRGAGPEGLAAMPRERPLGRGRLLRPLLELPRSTLERYAHEQQLQWIEDPSNSNTRYDRNFLRHEVMPRLRERWPAQARTFARTATQLRTLLDELPAPVYTPCESAVGDPGILLEALPGDEAGRARVLRQWLRDLGLTMPSSAQLGSLLAQLATGRGAQLRTGSWVLERYREGIYCYPPVRDSSPEPLSVRVGEWLEVAGVGAVRVERTSDDRSIQDSMSNDDQGELTLRFRRGGERLLQADGHNQDLKTLFQTLGIPPWWRARVPLLYAGNKLLAAGPYRRSAQPEAAMYTVRWEPLVSPPPARAQSV